MQKIIVGNWKMFGNAQFVLEYFSKLIEYLSEKNDKNIIIAIPFCYFDLASKILQHSSKKTQSQLQIAAQNISHRNEIASTGEISTSMLQDFGIKNSLIGHSERRIFFNENNEIILQKIQNCLENSINPIFCIGENLANKEENISKKIIKMQLSAVFDKIQNNEILIAYEPIWSIGTGKIPQISEISEIIDFIKNIIGKNKVLYGGSVNEKNASEILEIGDLDGVLVGGVSLKIDEFLKIIDFN